MDDATIRYHEDTGLFRDALRFTGNEPIDVTLGRLARLRTQLESRLRPVLRSRDYEGFNLDQAFGRVAQIASLL